jgi:membrane protein XagC
VNGTAGSPMSRTVAAAPIAVLAFVAMLALAAIAVRNGLVADDTLRLWAGASTAADGQVPIGRIVAGYPTLPFLATTLVAWLAPAGTPAPALVAAGLFSLIVAFCFLSFRRAGFHYLVAIGATLLIAFHPALLRAVIGGPSDMFLATFLLMLCLALYNLRARSGTSEVMGVGLALMALAFAHPVGAAFAFATMPFLPFAVRPLLVARSASNIMIALIFPTLFMVSAFAYVSWVFPGDGWTFFASPAQSLSLWRAAVARLFGNGLFGVPAIDASLAMIVALAIGAPVAVAMLALVYRRRVLVVPAAVFVGSAIAATVICVASGFFGDPTAIVVAAPVLAAAVLIRVPEARQRVLIVSALLILGWLGGLVSLALVDPITVNRLQSAFEQSSSERLDAIAAGGASAESDGVLADSDNAPALVLGRGGAHGLMGPDSEPFKLAMLFARVDTPFIAVPDPQSATGAHDRLNRAFPALFREGLAGYRIVYQNNTWRLFGKLNEVNVSKQ